MQCYQWRELRDKILLTGGHAHTTQPWPPPHRDTHKQTQVIMRTDYSDFVTVKLKLSAGVHIEECGVRPRRGQVAWAWAGDSGGPDIGPGPQSSDNTGTDCPWPMPRIKHRVILDKIRSHVAVSHDNDCDTHPVWAG